MNCALRRGTLRAWSNALFSVLVVGCATSFEEDSGTLGGIGAFPEGNTGGSVTSTGGTQSGTGGSGSSDGSGGSGLAPGSDGGFTSGGTSSATGGDSSSGGMPAPGTGGGSGACTERTWYEDKDNDGFGNPARTTNACNQPNGYVAAASDCKDSDPAVFPDASELCDAIDNDCDSQTNDICPAGCKAATLAGRSYMFCSTRASFDMANGLCENQQMRLARIDDSGENSFLRTMAGTEAWVGGLDREKEGTWAWLDETEFFVGGVAVNGNYVNWNTNEPNAAFASEDCLELLSSGTWNDCSCTEDRPFLCERY